MLDQQSIDQLRSRMRGSVLASGEPQYEEARRVWNGMIDRRPAAIVRCTGTADIAAGIRFARERGLAISVKGGGHNISGLAVGDDCLTLDTSAMRGVWVDPDRRVARAQAGCLLADVDRETQVHGLAAVLGFVSNTGIAGLTLGGGFGYLTRRYGWTCDNVRSIELVTAAGKVTRATETENPDLFWGLRGGGGNFGVVTNFEYELYPVGPEIVGGLIAWRADDAAAVLQMYREFAEQASPEITSVLVLRNAPPAPWLPQEVHGKPIIGVLACHSGSLERAERELAPLKKFGSPVGDVVMRRPYTVQQSILDATQPHGRRYYWKSEYLPGISSSLLEEATAHAAQLPSPHSAVVLFPIGGALDRLPTDHSAVGNRDANWVLNITAAWESPADDAVNIAWARDVWGDLRRYSTGGTYVNFLTEEEVGDRIEAAYGVNHDRLREVKRTWDPENVFRMNKNIEPAKLVVAPPPAA